MTTALSTACLRNCSCSASLRCFLPPKSEPTRPPMPSKKELVCLPSPESACPTGWNTWPTASSACLRGGGPALASRRTRSKMRLTISVDAAVAASSEALASASAKTSSSRSCTAASTSRLPFTPSITPPTRLDTELFSCSSGETTFGAVSAGPTAAGASAAHADAAISAATPAATATSASSTAAVWAFLVPELPIFLRLGLRPSMPGGIPDGGVAALASFSALMADASCGDSLAKEEGDLAGGPCFGVITLGSEVVLATGAGAAAGLGVGAAAGLGVGAAAGLGNELEERVGWGCCSGGDAASSLGCTASAGLASFGWVFTSSSCTCFKSTAASFLGTLLQQPMPDGGDWGGNRGEPSRQGRAWRPHVGATLVADFGR